MMQEMFGTSYLFGSNAPFIEELYDAYLADPASVDGTWRQYFDALQRSGDGPDVSHEQVRAKFAEMARRSPYQVSASSGISAEAALKQVAVLQLIGAYRFLGVRHAQIDPLKRQEKPYIQELDPSFYGLSDADMETEFNTGSLVGPQRATLRQILTHVRETYCGSIGFEYMYISDPAQKKWIQQRFESIHSRPSYDAAYKLNILERLTAAETLEKYLHTKYVGQTRFSLEGGETLIPMLDILLQRAGAQGVKESVIGMAHRGRLNVLVNTLGKMPKDLFAEFEGKMDDAILYGDVIYHDGFSSDITTPGGPMHLALAFNPSHLEIVNPVVTGSVRARQHRRGDKLGREVMPILIHGDASYAGQGVVMETLNLSQTRGFGTGGTMHLIINNQIGFTISDPRDSRSSLYCSDVSKMIEAPIFHVNADDPEAVALVVEAALDFRMEFRKDVVVDMVCYRRPGHNEQDEPMVTQPLMYKVIGKKSGARKLYADKLAAEGVVTDSVATELISTYRTAMDGGYHTNKTVLANFKPPYAPNWEQFKGTKWNENDNTQIPLETLKELGRLVSKVPDDFKLHPRVQKIMEDRRLMAEGSIPLDWGMAETQAYASLLKDGFAIRMSGQDAGRGTFFHRHAVLHDQNRERWDSGTYIPLQNLFPGQPDFTVIDSLLSEEAVLGFEYGYSSTEPNELVIWEAQYGDFVNGAQVVIDQFIASGEVKWGRMSGLVMMLPHGYEGAGPEHSSGRIERFLQLCADYNMQVCYPATPVQMFYLLRRQMIRPYRKPLIIFTPKSILRHKESVSQLEEFALDKFRPVNSEWDEDIDPATAKRVVFCSGKVFFDLRAARRDAGVKDVALVRISQLYPFPHDEYKEQIDQYPAAKEIVWCQEEPRNQGAWYWVQHYLRRPMRKGQKLFYAGRVSSATPAVGYKKLHAIQQKELDTAEITLVGGETKE
ncbi:MAG: 2-oxoglutarate dehydrogenase E1 component [bacterium]